MADTGPTPDGEVSQSPDSDRPSMSTDATLLKAPSLPPIPKDPLIGQVVANRYRIEEVIGQGGMGRVYRAVHVHMQKNVAIKVLRQEMTAVAEVVARFEREAVAAGRICHPNVAAATDFGRLSADGAFYLALEYVNGQSLRQELKKGSFSQKRALGVAMQICDALAAAHQQGVIHRDLKPDNILLLEDAGGELVKVLDFGIAKFDDPETAGDDLVTRMGLVMGTPQYMSPEQAMGTAIDQRSDLYSLGILLYEMLSGRAPFEARTLTAALSQRLASAPPALPRGIPRDLAKLCLSLLAKEPQARPTSAAAVLESLKAAQLSQQPVTPISSNSQPAHRRVRDLASQRWRGAQRRVGQLATQLRATWQKVWHAATTRWQWLRALERRVHLGPYSPAAGTILAAAIGLVCVVAVWVKWESTPSSTPSQQATPLASASPSLDPEPTSMPSSREALDELLAIPVYKRDREQWLTIAQEHTRHQERKLAVSAYRNALQLAPALKNDPQLLQHLRDLAVHHETHEAVANVALNLLDEPGVDLVYDVWLTTRDDDSKRAIANQARKNLAIFRLRSASAALRVPLALQFITPDQCEEVSKVLTDALQHADERAVPELEKLRQTTGCGVSKKRDCYPCLRPRASELDTAIRLAKARRAPRFDGKRYVPAPAGG